MHRGDPATRQDRRVAYEPVQVACLASGRCADAAASSGRSARQRSKTTRAARREGAAGRQALQVRAAGPESSARRSRSVLVEPRHRGAAGRACRGAAGGGRCSRTGAASTMRPAYMTSTRSQMPGDDAEIVGDEDDRRVVLARVSSRISSRICACTVTSSAVVGSSAISSSGRQSSAIAIITRWRMPPENSCG